MRLHFQTRDLRADYPRIGWLPPLPAGADTLWSRFSELHAGEYPEILLSQRNGEWSLYLSAINSGRTDSVVGAGRVIRISLYLSGRCGEEYGMVSNLIGQFLREVLVRGGASPRLKEIFQAKIHPGEPEKWKASPLQEQERIAAELLAEFSKLPPCPAVKDNPPPRWTGGCLPEENQKRFLCSCEELLSGRAEGMAISLANLSISECRRIQENNHVAILLSTPEEQNLPEQILPASSPHPNPSVPARPQKKQDRFDNVLKMLPLLFCTLIFLLLCWWLGGWWRLVGLIVILLAGAVWFMRYRKGRFFTVKR